MSTHHSRKRKAPGRQIAKKLFPILFVAAAVVGLIILWPHVSSSQQDVVPSGTAVQSGVVINEVMTSNKGIFTDDKGNSSDWVELYNETGQAIDLSQFGLSDDAMDGVKWAFPRVTLQPHGYVVVYLTGDSKSDIENGILHCSFRLSAQGETLILTNSSGQAVDTVEVPALDANVSYGRVDGQWQTLPAISPGFENSDAGIAAYQATRTVQDSPLRINEVMASNAMTIRNPAGDFSDWVEITNISGADYDLSGGGLSNDPADPLKWVFPAGTVIKPGETRLIYCSGVSSTEGDVLEAGFRLSSYSVTVTLSDASGRLLDSVTCSDMDSDWSYARGVSSGVPTDDWTATSQPTPGYANTAEGFDAFMQANPMETGDVVISEVLCSNNQTKFGDAQLSSDYIEIENRGAQAVNLAGYGLTDSASNPAKYRFPDVTVQPGERVVVLAAGAETAATDTQNLVAPFKLSRLGTTVALFDANDALLDRYFIGAVPQNISVGRAENSTAVAYFETPTPGTANGEGKAGIAAAVQFSEAPGKYDGAVQLTLTASEGCDIYYTTDGGTPSESSPKYTGPITVSQTTSVRARALRSDYIASATATSTYFIGAGHTLPLISVTTDNANLFDPTTGIYMEGPNASQVPGEYKVGANFYSDTEVSASFEVYDESGQRVFSQNLALRMSGGLTLALRNQKSFAVIARSQYGPSTMQYAFFDNRPFTEYKSLVLRQGGRDDTKLKEYVALQLVDGKMNVVTQASKPYVLYVNGQYFGVYYMMEKRNKYMVAAHEGITDGTLTDSINLVKGSGRTYVNNGTNSGYVEILDYVAAHDMSAKENYDWLAARLDTDSFMDYMINEIYIGNNDPGNMQFYQIPPDGKWIQIYQDVEITFQSFDTVALRRAEATTGSTMFNALLSYKPWRDAFIERFAWTMENIYAPDKVNALIDQSADAIRGEITAEHDRWGDLVTQEKWEQAVQGMRDFANTRGAAVVNHLTSGFSLTQEQIDMLNAAVK